MLVLVVTTTSGRNVMFTKLDNIYPECKQLIRGIPQLNPLICLNSSCHMDNACMKTLAIRVNLMFDAFPSSDLLILYFKYQDSPSLRGGIFWNDMREPKRIIINPYAWKKYKNQGNVYEWDLPSEVFKS